MQARNLVILALLGAGLAFAGSARASQSAGVETVDNPDASALGDLAGYLPAPGDLLDLGGIFGGAAVTGANQFSADGLARLADEEGFSATPYPDYKGQSIGYGHLMKAGEDWPSITREEGAALLASDVAWAVEAVNGAVSVPLTQGQFDALVMFAFNVGAGAFRSSTLVRLLNAGDQAGAAAQFPRWVNAGGAVNPALVARRSRERALFEGEA